MPGMLSILRPRRKQPKVPLGSFRERLDFTNPNGTNGMLVQAFYPAESGKMLQEQMPFFRDEVLTAFSEMKGSARGPPRWFLRSLMGHDKQLDPPLPPAKPDKVKKWPIAVFTSGLMGSCEMYTQFCRDLAAEGMIVLALEHEDGSGIHARTSEGSRIAYVEPPEEGDVVEFRRPFLEFRRAELTAATKAIQALAKTESEASEKSSPLAEVLRTGDANDMVLLAHSFGAAGALCYLKELADQGADCPYRSAVMLDLWTEPLPTSVLEAKPQVPVAILMSSEWVETFPAFLEGNLLLSKSAGENCLATLHVRGTTHQWISETQLVGPSFVLRKAGILGSGAFARVHEATLRSTVLLLEASRKPSGQAELLDELAKVDPEVIELNPNPGSEGR